MLLDKQREIDQLDDEVDRLKRTLGKRRHEKQDFYGVDASGYTINSVHEPRLCPAAAAKQE
jgi:hypothetical protein